MNARKLAPLTGVLFVVIMIVGFAIGGETPDADATAQKVVDYYTAHDTDQMLGAGFLSLGSVLLLAFASTLRNALRRAEGANAGGSTLSFAGAVLIAVGMTIFAGLTFTLGDVADKLDPSAAQALNALNSDLFFPLAVGVAAFQYGNAVAILRTNALPRWLGWISLVIGIVAVTPIGFFAVPATGLWILAAAIVLYTRVDAAPAAQTS